MRVGLEQFLEREDGFGYDTDKMYRKLLNQPWDNREGFKLYQGDTLVSSTIAPQSYLCLSSIRQYGPIIESDAVNDLMYRHEIKEENIPRFTNDLETFRELGIVQREVKRTRFLQREQHWLSLGNIQGYDLEFPALEREEAKEGDREDGLLSQLFWGMLSSITHATCPGYTTGRFIARGVTTPLQAVIPGEVIIATGVAYDVFKSMVVVKLFGQM